MKKRRTGLMKLLSHPPRVTLLLHDGRVHAFTNIDLKEAEALMKDLQKWVAEHKVTRK